MPNNLILTQSCGHNFGLQVRPKFTLLICLHSPSSDDAEKTNGTAGTVEEGASPSTWLLRLRETLKGPTASLSLEQILNERKEVEFLVLDAFGRKFGF